MRRCGGSTAQRDPGCSRGGPDRSFVSPYRRTGGTALTGRTRFRRSSGSRLRRIRSPGRGAACIRLLSLACARWVSHAAPGSGRATGRTDKARATWYWIAPPKRRRSARCTFAPPTCDLSAPHLRSRIVPIWGDERPCGLPRGCRSGSTLQRIAGAEITTGTRRRHRGGEGGKSMEQPLGTRGVRQRDVTPRCATLRWPECGARLLVDASDAPSPAMAAFSAFGGAWAARPESARARATPRRSRGA